VTTFWLGAHIEGWLATVDVPLFVSHRRLARRVRLPVARGPWALDSGGFTELSMFGAWQTTEVSYGAAVRRYQDEIGGLAWAAPMDWMCEPFMLAKTRLTVEDHQRLTVENYLRLSETGLPFVPVLQGWTLDDYLRCVDLYARAGIDLPALALVGIGSICRRQNTGQVGLIVSTIAGLGISLHGFGVKVAGLSTYADSLASADSMAWSFRARRSPALPGCTHKSCANCLRFALAWREKVMRRISTQQLRLAV